VSSDRPEYPPLTARHKRVFAVAAVLAVAYASGLALARLALIRWWLGNCKLASTACTWADLAFTWWWAALIAGILALAFVAHRLTADRLHIP
jgi:hypothetical protein